MAKAQKVARVPLKPDGGPVGPVYRRRLLEAIHRAQSWLDDLLQGRVTGMQEIAAREARSDRNIRMFLNLAFLAPDLIEAILTESFPAALSANQIAQSLPMDWADQRRMLVSANGR